MTIRGIENMLWNKNTSGAASTSEQGVEFNEKFLGNLIDQKDNEDAVASRNLKSTVSVQYAKTTSSIQLHDSGHISAGVVTETAVRHISYEQSDKLVINPLEGYTMKSQVNVTAHSVYVEVKTETGEVFGYEVNPLLLDQNTKEPVEMLALESWEKLIAKVDKANEEMLEAIQEEAENSREGSFLGIKENEAR